MGFGILFFGYFLVYAFSILPWYFYADIVGCLVMTWALSILSSHKRAFRRVAYANAAVAVISLVRAVGRTFSLWVDGDAVGVAFTLAWAAAALVFHFFLTGAVHGLAEEAEDRKIISRASFNRSFSATAYLFFIAHTSLKRVLPAEVTSITEKLALLLLIACLLTTSLLIYSSFVSFIPVTGEIPEPKKSRFALVNKIRQKTYERRKRALDENREMYEDYLSRKNEPAHAKKTKKKK